MKTFVQIGVLVTLAALTACASHKTTVATSSGDATITQSGNGQQVTVQSSSGTVTVGGSVDPSNLGAPVYPGAEANTTMNVTGSDAGAMAAFKTNDDFDKVYDWYKSQLPAGSEKMKMSSGDGSVAEFVIEGANGKTAVQVTGKAGETEILITHSAKN